MKLRTALPIAALAGFALTANAATVVTVTGITAHDGGNWPSWHGHLTDMVNALNPTLLDPGDGPTTGMDTSANPADPSTWTFSGNYQKTWHANSVLAGAANNKIGWVTMDLGGVVDNLENAYLWASESGASLPERVKDYNLYYSSGAGIDGLPAMPQSKGTTGDYDFSSGDWTQIGGTNTLGSTGSGVSNTIALGGVSAQYIGIEVLSLHGTGARMAIAQVEITAVPEPSSLALLGLSGLALLRRRR